MQHEMLPFLRQAALHSENSVDSGEFVTLPCFDFCIACSEVIPEVDEQNAIYDVPYLQEQQNRATGPIPIPGDPIIAVMPARSPPAGSEPAFAGSHLLQNDMYANGMVGHVHELPGVMIPHSASNSPDLTQAQWQTANAVAATPDEISGMYDSSVCLRMLAALPAEPYSPSTETPTGAACAASLHMLRAPTPTGFGIITTEQTLRSMPGSTNTQQRSILDSLARPKQEPHQAPLQILPLQCLQQPSPLQYQQQYYSYQQQPTVPSHQQQGSFNQSPVPGRIVTGRGTPFSAARPSVQPEPKQRAPSPFAINTQHQSPLPVTPLKAKLKTVEQQQLQPQQLQETASAEGTPERKRRGRPPNKPGEHSRGYLAIKAYRQRNKEKAYQDECRIASLKEEVERLQADQQQLLLRRSALELTVAASDDVIAQLAGLQLAVGAEPSTPGMHKNTGGIGVASGVVARVLTDVLAASGTYSTPCDVDWSYVLAFTESQVQLTTRQSKETLMRLQYDAGTEAAGRYKAYVEDATAKISHIDWLPASTAASAAGTFAPFPLDTADMVRLWQLYRSAPPATGDCAGAYGLEPASPANSSSGSRNDLSHGGFTLLDLEMGAVVQVGDAYWATVAGAVQLYSEAQKQLLEVLLHRYTAALQKLERDRQQLLQLSQASGEQLDSCISMAAAVEGFMVRALALVLTFERAMLSTLSAEQISRICVVSWPHMPIVSAVVRHLVGKAGVHASHEGHASSAEMDHA